MFFHTKGEYLIICSGGDFNFFFFFNMSTPNSSSDLTATTQSGFEWIRENGDLRSKFIYSVNSS